MNTHCSQCGMCLKEPSDYHPFAACLMFLGCQNGNTVQVNLDAVVEYGRQQALAAQGNSSPPDQSSPPTGDANVS